MKQTNEDSHKAKIEQAAHEYCSEGYEVIVAPTVEQLPAFLHPFKYGLLDRDEYQLLQSGMRARNTIVHGYKQQQSLGQVLTDLLSLAERLAEEPLPA